MPTLRIQGGIAEAVSGKTERRAGGNLQVTRRSAVRIAAGRGTTAQALTVELKGDDVVLLELEGGFKLWVRGDDFQKEFGTQAKRGIKPDELIELSPELQVGSPVRGMGNWILKGLEIFDVHLTDTAATKIAELVEKKLDRDPGLYAVNLNGSYALKDRAPQLPTDRPLLIFIHGTASSTSGSFGQLWKNVKAKEALARHYGEMVFAYEHYTLTQSPIDNALELVNVLPAQATVHLVSHSRGGLVGELLCRGQRSDGRDPFEGPGKKLFNKKERERDLKTLDELNRELKERQIRVERFVRVACPARGTTLASERLDRWLSVVVNLLEQIPALAGSLLYEGLNDFLLAVVKEHLAPRTLPGLEAMMPDSPLIRMLNLPGVRVDADLSVISGDVEAEGFWDTLRLLIPDLFYGGDHDYVVNTGSMYGGALREKGARFFLDQGPRVNHFHYFSNEKTVQMLIDGLTRPEGGQVGFTTIEKARQEVPARAARGPSGPRPVVFLLPDIMGSHLAVNGDRIWLDISDLALGGLKRLNANAANVQPQAVVAMAYGDLVDYLSGTHKVITFPYDWRLSVRSEARRLAEAVEGELDSAERSNQPVRLVAHSMGGLVVRALIANHPQVWKRICRHPGGRLIMLGTPTGGSYEIVRVLVGQAEILRNLALLDITQSKNQLLGIFCRYPGVLEMLPEESGTDFFSAAYWAGLIKSQDARGDWVLPAQQRLQDAAATRQALKNIPMDPDHVLYIAGCSPATACGLRIAEGENGDGNYIEFLASPRGDGRVLWDTGIPPGVKAWYMEEVEHGDLADHKAAFPALLELLQTGETKRLPARPPVPARGLDETFPLPRAVVPMLPDEDALTAAALGSRHRPARPKAPTRRVKVSVTHANLGYTRHPVAVGHYHGDTIVGAEAYLDSVLQGRLRRHQQLGIYPGMLNTAEVFINSDAVGKPGGAIVMGLGRVGELSQGTLTSSFARAALVYAITVAESCDKRFQTAHGVTRSAAKITSLLIGTGAGGISVEDSVNAILRGVLRANSMLQETRPDSQVIIDELEFVELWQDVAIEAGQALERVGKDPELRGHFDCEFHVGQGIGGLSRIQWQDDPAWWHRMQILADKDGHIRFSALTERARAEVSLLPTQRALVDRFIEQAITTTASSQDMARTLFELLLPNRLKEKARGRYNLVLVLNEESACYPWEMLEDRWGETVQPMAVQAGILRQLESKEFRERVLMTTENTAYVVGDPVSNFVPLPGAEAEATTVADLLSERKFRVERQVRAEALAIVTSLHARAYRVLHLAGHGVHEQVLGEAQQLACELCGQPYPDRKPKKVSGMVIGANIFLTPADVEQMRQVPELVFINCCHLGRTDSIAPGMRRDDYHKLAANVAAQFIGMGVKAVVAAGWAVDDEAAKTFARKFYEAMLVGVPFGEAVRQARSETYFRHSGVNTWSAYQCYGDPDYRLIVEPWPGTHREELPYVSPAEVVAELTNLASEAKTANDKDLKTLRERIDKILKRADQAWLKRGDVTAAMGLAYGELGEFDKAIENLDQAFSAEKAEFSVRAIEQRANFKSRWAVELAHSGRKADGDKEPGELIQEAIEELERLTFFTKTVERLSLLGSAYKRKAWISFGSDRKAALECMASCYQEAHENTYQSGKGKLDTYLLLNWLVAEVLLVWPRKLKEKTLKEIKHWCRQAEARAEEKESQEPDFWNTVVKPDCDVLRALAGQTLDRDQQAIVEGYMRAKKRGASPREFCSALEHLEFLAEIVFEKGGSEEIRKHVDTLRELRDKLEALAS